MKVHWNCGLNECAGDWRACANRMQVIYANFFADYAKTNVNYHYDMADNAKTNGMLWHDQLCQFTRWMQCLQLNSRRRTVMERGERVIGMRPV